MSKEAKNLGAYTNTLESLRRLLGKNKEFFPKNLINTVSPDHITGYFYDIYGSLTLNSKYNITEYITVDGLVGKVLLSFYIGEKNSIVQHHHFRFVTFFDNNKNFIASTSITDYRNYYLVEDVADAVYMRISYENTSLSSETESVIICSEEDFYNSLISRIVLENKNSLQLASTVLSVNSNLYRNDDGLVASEYYSSCEFVPQRDKLYYIHLNTGGGLPSDLNFMTVLDSNDNVIYRNKSSLSYKGWVFPSNAVKVVLSYRNLCDPLLLTEGKNSNENYNLSGDLTSGVTYYIGENNYIKKNVILTYFIQFTTFSNIRIGRGVGEYWYSYVDVNSTQIIATTKNGVVSTESHGLTILDYLVISLESDDYNQTIVKIRTNGGTFTSAAFDFYGDGRPYIIPYMDCQLYKACEIFKDIKKTVRYYGDSYSGTNNVERWPYQAALLGADFLVNGLTGGTSVELYEMVVRDMWFGKPNIVIWGLGMNDGSDADENTPNATWKYIVDSLIQLSYLLDFELILCTIPNVPSRYHGGKNKYIRELGFRYIDFDSIVDNGIDYTWKSGMLSADNIHPSKIGAIALAHAAIASVSELFV